jgi:hypothetical protein
MKLFRKGEANVVVLDLAARRSPKVSRAFLIESGIQIPIQLTNEMVRQVIRRRKQ